MEYVWPSLKLKIKLIKVEKIVFINAKVVDSFSFGYFQISMETEALKFRSNKMYEAQLFQGDKGPGDPSFLFSLKSS